MVLTGHLRAEIIRHEFTGEPSRAGLLTSQRPGRVNNPVVSPVCQSPADTHRQLLKKLWGAPSVLPPFFGSGLCDSHGCLLAVPGSFLAVRSGTASRDLGGGVVVQARVWSGFAPSPTPQ